MIRKLLMTAVALLLTVTAAQAQTFVFRYHCEDIPDGGMVTIPAVEDEFGFGELWCETNPSSNPNQGLMLKLLSTGTKVDGEATLDIDYNTLNPSTLKWCMGGDCSMMIGKTTLTKDFTVKDSVQVQFDAENCQATGYLLATLTATIGGETHTVQIQFTNGESAGLKPIDNGQLIMDNVYYDLSGRRVENPTKGVYILRGRKLIIDN